MFKRVCKIIKTSGYYEEDKNGDLEPIVSDHSEKEIRRSSVMEVLSTMMEFARQHPNAKIDEGGIEFFLVDRSEDGKIFNEIGIQQFMEEK